MAEPDFKKEVAEKCCPFPTITPEGLLSDGILFVQPKVCKKCKEKKCKTFHSDDYHHSIEHFTCLEGMSIFLVRLPFGEFIANGLIETILNTVCKPAVRKK